MATALRRGVMVVVMRIFGNRLRSCENAAHQHGAHQRVTQFHCALPQNDLAQNNLDWKRPNAANLAHTVNGFQTAGTL